MKRGKIFGEEKNTFLDEKKQKRKGKKYLEKEKIFFVRRLKRKRKIREIFGKGENTFCGGKDKNRERNGREYLEKELFWEE